MSRIEQLIQEMCPNGVERVALGEVGSFKRGNGLQKSELQSEGLPAIHYGQIHTIYHHVARETQSFVTEEKFEKLKKAAPGDIILATTSEDDEAVGKAIAWLGDSEVAVSGDAIIYTHTLDPSYVSYFLESSAFQDQKAKHISGTKVRRISSKSLSTILIPFPPLDIQQEIVRILDQLTEAHQELDQSLEAEIERREKQLETVIDDAFQSLTETTVKLGDVGEFVRGNGLQKKDLKESGFQAIHYGQLHTIYRHKAVSTLSYVDENYAVKLKKANPGDVILATTSEDDESLGKATAWLGDGPVAVSGDSFIYQHDFDPLFISFWFRSSDFRKQKQKFISGTKVRRLAGKSMEKMISPLPPVKVQEEIALKLDQLDTTLTEYIDNLKRERELRQKQYEYYRDHLLDFDVKE